MLSRTHIRVESLHREDEITSNSKQTQEQHQDRLVNASTNFEDCLPGGGGGRVRKAVRSVFVYIDLDLGHFIALLSHSFSPSLSLSLSLQSYPRGCILGSYIHTYLHTYIHTYPPITY